MKNTLNQRIAHLELPDRMRSLKISDEGFPVPWFVGYVDGKPDFRTMDGEKLVIAVRHRRCWMCGSPLGKHLTFSIGPMCAVNRNIAEPPSHLSCAEYSVRACPFLSNSRMKRNEKDLPDIPENVRNDMKLHFVESMDEVLDIALERKIEMAPITSMLNAAEIVARSQEKITH